MKQHTYLEFEELITDLEVRLAEMQKRAESSNVDVSQAIEALQQRITALTKETFKRLTPWQRIQLSRHPHRPYSLDYIDMIATDFVEVHGDRRFSDDKAIIAGFAKIDFQTFMIIGQQKGRNTKDRQYRNFGMPNPEGYRKAIRLMKLAEKFEKPILTLIDTPGAYPGIGAEARGQAEAIAYNMQEMLKLKVPVICVVIGEGASGGAIAIGIGDRVYMMENTWYSVISPESCSSILWRSWEYKEQAADALKLTAKDMHKHKLIDGIIAEPLGGAHRHPKQAAEILRSSILKAFEELEMKKPDQLIAERMEKFSNMGVYKAPSPQKNTKKTSKNHNLKSKS